MNKISILVLTVDETLKNAQKTLFEDLKVVKIEHVAIQHLINQIERTKVELELINKASIIIDQMHAKDDFQFASIDLTKQTSKTTSSSYNDTMSENFQNLEKAMKKKITKLINKRFENQSSRTHINTITKSSKRANSNMNANIKEKSQTLKTNQTSQKTQSSKKSQINNTNSDASSFI